MLKLPLLTSARPVVGKVGPFVMLKIGQWKIVGEGLENSRLTLFHDAPQFVGERVFASELKFINNMIITGPAAVSIRIDEAGNESYINVNAEFQGD